MWKIFRWFVPKAKFTLRHSYVLLCEDLGIMPDLEKFCAVEQEIKKLAMSLTSPRDNTALILCKDIDTQISYVVKLENGQVYPLLMRGVDAEEKIRFLTKDPRFDGSGD